MSVFGCLGTRFAGKMQDLGLRVYGLGCFGGLGCWAWVLGLRVGCQSRGVVKVPG